MTEILQDDGRWVKVPAGSNSEIYKYGMEKNDPPLAGAPCFICRAPAENWSFFHTWRDNGEEAASAMYVCAAHIGEWWWHPYRDFTPYDGETQRSN